MVREFESSGSQRYDVLIVDAFQNDAIPTHLLTQECGDTYFRHLQENGVLLVHISNRFLDLESVVRGLAAAHRIPVVRVHAGMEPERGAATATWMVLTRNESLRERLVAVDETPSAGALGEVFWTDDFSAIWPVMR
jgi:spermidine synthase